MKVSVMSNTTELYGMRLFERVREGGYEITRVPGGWLFYVLFSSLPMVFVPYCEDKGVVKELEQ